MSPGLTVKPASAEARISAGSQVAMSTTGRPLAMASYSFDGTAPRISLFNVTTAMSAEAKRAGIAAFGAAQERHVSQASPARRIDQHRPFWTVADQHESQLLVSEFLRRHKQLIQALANSVKPGVDRDRP
jgi:hypothetical protein